jgi:hypothetical protein
MVMQRGSRGRRTLLGALVVLGALLLPAIPLAPSMVHPGAPGRVAIATVAVRPASPVGAAPLAPHPLVTTLFDWDPQPIVLPPSLNSSQIGGEGAVMATSDPFRTAVLFGGETPVGLTNLTISVSESSGGWDTRAVVGAPSPRANASFVTIDDGRYAVLFGGVVNLATGASDNQTWRYDFANRSWTNETQSVAPPPREGAAFAAEPNGSRAVLEGGWDPGYAVGGAGASVTWNDTWLLNLTDFQWTRATAAQAPRPMFGSSMVYDPQNGSFLLFGGCSSVCSNTLFAYRPGGNWTRAPESGDIPSPRGSASEVWASDLNVSMLMGGFEWGNNSYVGLNDSFIFTPATHTWDLVAGSNGPSDRFAAAASYLVANQCPGMFVVGGSSALLAPPADGWFLDTNPDYGNGCNVWGGDQVGGNKGPPPNCAPAENMTVQVVDNLTRLALANASVELLGACGNVGFLTNAFGVVNFTGLPNENLTIETAANGYHGSTIALNDSQPSARFVTVALDHLPRLQIQTYGVTFAHGVQPLGDVSVIFEPVNPLGNSSASGWLNISAFGAPEGPATFIGYYAGYSNASATVAIPWTGLVAFTLTLLADGAFHVHVLESPDGTGVIGAVGMISPVGALTFGGPVAYTTGAGGWFNTSLPQANYTVSASGAGFRTNATRLPVFHPWIDPTLVELNLTLLYGANLSVRLLDANTQRPIGFGQVQLGYNTPKNSSPSGWANFTDVLPPGRYSVTGTAPNYLSNATIIDLTYLVRYPSLFLNLTPAPTCPPDCQTSGNGTAGLFHLLPSAGLALDLFLLAPALLGAAGLAYALYLRRSALGARAA